MLAQGTLLKSGALKTDCFDWPSTEFSPSNHAVVSARLPVYSTAVDFALADVGGVVYQLSSLLKTRPVVLQFAAYTCPVYQGNVAASKTLASKYGNRAWYLYLYGPEAHPVSPYVSPYSGEVWMTSNYSVLPQAYSYSDRLQNAERCVAGEQCSPISEQWIMLVDALPGANQSGNDPVWCTYGTSPNGGYVIAQNGTVLYSEKWIDFESVNQVLSDLFQEMR